MLLMQLVRIIHYHRCGPKVAKALIGASMVTLARCIGFLMIRVTDLFPKRKLYAKPWPCKVSSIQDASVWSGGTEVEVTKMGGCCGCSIFGYFDLPLWVKLEVGMDCGCIIECLVLLVKSFSIF